MTSFTIRAVPTGRTSALVLSGEIDLAAADDVSEFGELMMYDPDIDNVIVDVRAVTFIDSTGIGALVGLRNSALAAGKSLTMSDVPSRVRRILQITGLEAVFGLDTTTAAAD